MKRMAALVLSGLVLIPLSARCSGLTESAQIGSVIFGLGSAEEPSKEEARGLCNYALPCPEGATCQARAYDTPDLTRAQCDALCDTKGIDRHFPSWSNGSCGWHASTPFLTVSDGAKSP